MTVCIQTFLSEYIRLPAVCLCPSFCVKGGMLDSDSLSKCWGTTSSGMVQDSSIVHIDLGKFLACRCLVRVFTYIQTFCDGVFHCAQTFLLHVLFDFPARV